MPGVEEISRVVVRDRERQEPGALPSDVVRERELLDFLC